MQRLLSWWFTDRATGRVVVAQAPNPALVVWIAAAAGRIVSGTELDHKLSWIGSGALVVWGLDELLRGVNPFRRLLGAVVLGWQLTGLFAS